MLTSLILFPHDIKTPLGRQQHSLVKYQLRNILNLLFISTETHEFSVITSVASPEAVKLDITRSMFVKQSLSLNIRIANLVM